MRVPEIPHSSWLLASAPKIIGSGPNSAQGLYLPSEISIFKVEVRKPTRKLLPIKMRVKKTRSLI